MITRKAYAKINLGLDVIGRRDDGYHLVRMIMQSIDLSDDLSFEKRDDNKIVIETSDPRIPTDEHNLIYKAADQLRSHCNATDLGVTIRLEKHIPMAAGMAGGSTDAAATYIALSELWNLGLNTEELCALAVKKGADIPYCIKGGTALSEGIGEELTALPDMPSCHIVIAKPLLDVSTAWAYTTLDSAPIAEHPDIDGIKSAIEEGDLTGITDRLGNVLEPITSGKYPVIEEIRQILLANGAKGARMSGSGPTVFGIFENKDLVSANNAVKELQGRGIAPELFLTKPINSNL
ncbi:4-diphosphocytidyl-2-C-methyl-D-erythritol kinase [Butyrivibrio sp. ob235]|uniref:4-(cytidine 5'-diphospho)-2-C-methyl-D-erythritol kinase n=1 Tax=Butyrivibrio sp. ob235 TaxID=1761780 RepID=UPI0008BA6B7F|nr:4-(cytidine 5'-diphospho)-2-C-methyl-D-erythritol kinase [Butyrivibrio sp. ob235]SEK89685.1 4-diphosphocytidyl-2-C-methyl-D-erythritol kinase [Butyrivibrio sp. ob235]